MSSRCACGKRRCLSRNTGEIDQAADCRFQRLCAQIPLNQTPLAIEQHGHGQFFHLEQAGKIAVIASGLMNLDPGDAVSAYP